MARNANEEQERKHCATQVLQVERFEFKIAPELGSNNLSRAARRPPSSIVTESRAESE